MMTRSFVILLLLLSSTVNAAPVWNIVEHGARAREDIGPIVQRGLDTQHEHGLPVFVPPGVWYLKTPIVTPFRTGGALLGAGLHQRTGSGEGMHRAINGVGTFIYYVGPRDKPAITVTGTHYRIGMFALGGQRRQNNKNVGEKADLGLLITKPDDRRGLGTGKFHFFPLRFHDFKVGIQNGASADEQNCESNLYESLGFSHCDVGMELRNTQGMGHWIKSVGASTTTPVLFDVYGGGMLHVERGICGSTLLRISSNTPSKFSTGHANATFTFRNIKVDATSKTNFCAVEMRDAAPVDIYLQGGRVSNKGFGRAGGKFAKLKGPAALTVRDWVADFTGAIEGERAYDATPNVLLDRCRLWCDADKIAVGDVTFKTRDCYGWGAEPKGIEIPAAEGAAGE